MKIIGYFSLTLFFGWIGCQIVCQNEWPLIVKITPFLATFVAFAAGVHSLRSQKITRVYLSPGWNVKSNPQTGIPLVIARGKAGKKDRDLMN